MCWITNFTPKLMQAKSPIPIFKIVQRNLKSAYFGFEYELNTVYKQQLGNCCPTVFNTYNIHEGIHSYKSEDVIIRRHRWNPICMEIINKRIDSCLDFFLIFSYVKVCGFIPKGSNYYINEFGEYISDSIVLTEVIDINEIC